MRLFNYKKFYGWFSYLGSFWLHGLSLRTADEKFRQPNNWPHEQTQGLRIVSRPQNGCFLLILTVKPSVQNKFRRDHDHQHKDIAHYPQGPFSFSTYLGHIPIIRVNHITNRSDVTKDRLGLAHPLWLNWGHYKLQFSQIHLIETSCEVQPSNR